MVAINDLEKCHMILSTNVNCLLVAVLFVLLYILRLFFCCFVLFFATQLSGVSGFRVSVFGFSV